VLNAKLRLSQRSDNVPVIHNTGPIALYYKGFEGADCCQLQGMFSLFSDGYEDGGSSFLWNVITFINIHGSIFMKIGIFVDIYYPIFVKCQMDDAKV